MRLLHQRFAAEIGQHAGVVGSPIIQNLRKISENLRIKIRPLDPPVLPFQVQGPEQLFFVRIGGIAYASFPLSDIHPAAHCNGFEQCRLAGAVFSDEKSDRGLKIKDSGLP